MIIVGAFSVIVKTGCVTDGSFYSTTQDPVAVNDLAVVKLAAPVPFSPDISPICVAEDGAEGESGAQLTVAGWGRTRHSRQSSLLKFTELAWVPAAECARQYAAAGIPEVAIRASQLCAQGEGGTDSCSGDSGGPLMSQVRRNPKLQFFTSFSILTSVLGRYTQEYTIFAEGAKIWMLVRKAFTDCMFS